MGSTFQVLWLQLPDFDLETAPSPHLAHLLGNKKLFSSVQSLSHVRLFVTPWIAACQASLSVTISQSSFKLTSIESVMPSSHFSLCRPLLLPPIPPRIRVFSNESTLCVRWPKYWSFRFSIITSKEHPEKCKSKLQRDITSHRSEWPSSKIYKQ